MDESGLTDDQAGVIGLLSMCCCALVALSVVGVVIWLIVRAQKKPPASAASSPAHLSVMAFAFDAVLKDRLAAELAQPFAAFDAVTMRVELLRRAITSLTTVESAWRFFGYGEKELGDLASAEQSYRLAIDDFTARAQAPGDTSVGLVVLTLVIATRTRLGGVSRLDSRAEARALLDARRLIDGPQLLGAQWVWAPAIGALSETALKQRYPEMHEIARGAGP